MSHRTLAGLVVASLASSVLSSAVAQPAAVEVSLVSVTPGTPSGDGDWCISAGQPVTITARVVALETQSEITDGMLWWQLCWSSVGGFPKEACDAPGAPRWQATAGKDLSVPLPLSLTFTPSVPILGVRLQYVPAPGGAFKRGTSTPFNLDTTCSP